MYRYGVDEAQHTRKLVKNLSMQSDMVIDGSGLRNVRIWMIILLCRQRELCDGSLEV